MDKVKMVLAVLKKHHFWVLSAVIVVVALVSWAKATADLTSRFKARKTEIDGKFTAMQGICEQPNHPNAGVINAIKKKTGDLKDNVHKAWRVLYEEQKKNNQLPEVSKTFKAAFEALQKPTDELPPAERDAYRYFLRNYFPTLLDLIDYRHPVEQKPGEVGAAAADFAAPRRGFDRRGSRDRGVPRMGVGGRDSGDQAGVEMVGIVDWNEADRSRLESRLIWTTTPNTLEVRLKQEDLWVYEALLRVIKNTNAGATMHRQAAVKAIDALEIGRDAALGAQSSRSTFSLGSDASSGGPAGPGVDRGAAGAAAATRTGTSDSGAGAVDMTADLLSGRYVDAEGKPLAADAKHPYAEFKMMPIRMLLFIDQTKIPKLLVECANSNMPIEVQAVRLRPGSVTSLDLGALTAAAVAQAAPTDDFAGSRGRGRRGRGYSPDGRPSRGDTSSSALGPSDEKTSIDLPIEIQGIIYIFNPPDMEKLGTGTGTAGQEPPAAPAATGAAPATQPAAPAVQGPAATTPGPAPTTPGPAPAAPAPGPAPEAAPPGPPAPSPPPTATPPKA
jgi:hypothetical protein